MQILYNLLFLSHMDHSVRPEEQQLIHEVALRLGIRPPLTHSLLDRMPQHLTTKVPEEAMLFEMRKYLK